VSSCGFSILKIIHNHDTYWNKLVNEHPLEDSVLSMMVTMLFHNEYNFSKKRDTVFMAFFAKMAKIKYF